MSNKQFEEVEDLARQSGIDLRECPTCGSKREEVEPGSGVYVWPESTYKLDGNELPCNCEEQVDLQRHYLLANIPDRYWTLTFDEFYGDDHAKNEAWKYLQNWDNMRRHGIGLQFYSPTQGTGKTTLATLIAKDLVKRGVSVYFIPFRSTVRLYEMPYEERKQWVTRLRETPVLVLDEVGAAISDAQRSFFAMELEELIRSRTSGKSVTIVTTNLTPEELDDQYPRTFSLLSECVKQIPVGGVDVRRKGHVQLDSIELAINGEAQPIS